MSAIDFILQTPLGEIAALAWGADPYTPTNARVLCVHGWLDNAESFHTFAPTLVTALGGPSTVSVVAIDLPGHGKSTKFDFYSSGAFAAGVAVALDGLKWRTAILVGHAAGGGIAMIVAGALPERIVGLVMLESAGPPIRDASSAPAALKAALIAASSGTSDSRTGAFTFTAIGAMSTNPNSEALAISARIALSAALPGRQVISEGAAAILVSRSLSLPRQIPNPNANNNNSSSSSSSSSSAVGGSSSTPGGMGGGGGNGTLHNQLGATM